MNVGPETMRRARQEDRQRVGIALDPAPRRAADGLATAA
jgi:hypothetical protein